MTDDPAPPASVVPTDSAPARTATPVVTRAGRRLQVGADPATAVVVTAPPGVREADLAALLREPDSGDLDERAARIGLSRRQREELAAALRSAAPRPARKMRLRIHGRGPIAESLHGAIATAGHPVTRSVPTDRDIDTDPDPARRWRDDLVVLCDDLSPDERLVDTLLQRRTPHLLVRTRDGIGIVGPLVLPGRSSCLRCGDLYRRGSDPEWPTVAAQLSGRVGTARRTVVAVTVALAHAELDHIVTLSGDPPRTLGATIEVGAVPLTIGVRSWPRHPFCVCYI